MPRSLTTAVSGAVTQTERQIVELYQLTLVTSDVYYLANLETDVPSHAALGGVTWQAFPVKRDEAQFGARLDVDEMTVAVANREVTLASSATPLSLLAVRGVLDGAEVKMFLTDLTDPGGGRATHSVWKIQAAEADRAQVTLRLESVLADFQSMTPRRTWQEQCTWSLFSEWCALSRGAYTVYGRVHGSGTTTEHLQFTVSSVGASVPATIPGSWFDIGQARFTSGAAAGLRRTIRVQSASVVASTGEVGGLDLLTALPVTPASGDALNCVPGCNKTLDTCEVKFSNTLNFGGFLYIPKPETQYGV